MPSNGKYLMIAIHRTGVGYDARHGHLPSNAMTSWEPGLCPEVVCVLVAHKSVSLVTEIK